MNKTNFKLAYPIIEEVVKSWNKIVEDKYALSFTEYDGRYMVSITTKKDFHGSFLKDLSGILHPLTISWAVYSRDNGGLEINV